MESNDGSPSGHIRRETIADRGKRGGPHKMDNCDRCRHLKQKCTPENRNWSQKERCHRCIKANQPCSAPSRRARPRVASLNFGNPHTTPSRPRQADLLLATPSISNSGLDSWPDNGVNSPNISFQRSAAPAQYPTPSSGPALSARAVDQNTEGSSVREPLDGYIRPHNSGSPLWRRPLRPVTAAVPGESTADWYIDGLAQLVTMKESVDFVLAAIGPPNKLECDVSSTRREIDSLAWSLEKKTNRALEDIDKTTQNILTDVEASEKSEVQLLCNRALQVVCKYDNTNHKVAWLGQSEATLLRRLVSSYRSRGLWAEICRHLRRTSQIEGIKLDEDEQRLLAQAYEKTSSRTKPLLLNCDILPDDDSTFQSNHPFPALHRAIEDGQIEVVRLLLQETAFTALPLDIIKRHALHVAAASASIEMVQCVLEHTRSTDFRDLFHRTPLFYAARDGTLEGFRTLAQAGANLEDRDISSHSILAIAAGSGRLDIVQELLQKDIDPNHNPLKCMTPLMKAAEAGHLPVVQLLLSRGSRPNECLTNGKTAAAIAMERGFAECCLAIESHSSYLASSEDQTLVTEMVQAQSQASMTSRGWTVLDLNESDRNISLTDLAASPTSQMGPSALDSHLSVGHWSNTSMTTPAVTVNNLAPWPNDISQLSRQ